MDRRTFIKISGLSFAYPVLTGCNESAGYIMKDARQIERPNILWIISEDTSPDMACYGNELVKTPTFDRLASEGVMYTNAFATCPVCSPVRSGFMTGMYQTTIGAHQHRSNRAGGAGLPEPVKVITEYFRKAGYYTCNGNSGFTRPGKTDWNFKVEGKPFDGIDWRDRKKGQPFFAQVNLGMTHRVFKRDPQRPIDPEKVKLPPCYPDHPLARRDWADYLESIQVLDRDVERIMKRLDDDGLSDNTIVFYFGDHGRCHVRGKQWLYEGGIRVPLIIRYPGYLKGGSVCDDMVSSIDYGPTAMNLASIDIPGHMQGRPFLGKGAVSREYIIAARDRCDETDDRIRCVRNRRYKYIRNFHPERPYLQFNAYKKQQYPVLTLMNVLHKQGKLTEAQQHFMSKIRPPEELYDLSADPYEIKNLAGNSKYHNTLIKMRSLLDKWIADTDDKGEIPETADEKEYWDKFMAGQWVKWMKARGLSPDISDEDYLAWWEKKMLRK